MTGKQGISINTTDLAIQRTRMDNERDLIAWLRTGLAITGFGAVIPGLLANIEPEWLVDLIATLFVIVGLVTLVAGVQTYHRTMASIPKALASVSSWVVATIVIAFQVGAIAVLILFILD